MELLYLASFIGLFLLACGVTGLVQFIKNHVGFDHDIYARDYSSYYDDSVSMSFKVFKTLYDIEPDKFELYIHKIVRRNGITKGTTCIQMSDRKEGIKYYRWLKQEERRKEEKIQHNWELKNAKKIQGMLDQAKESLKEDMEETGKDVEKIRLELEKTPGTIGNAGLLMGTVAASGVLSSVMSPSELKSILHYQEERNSLLSEIWEMWEGNINYVKLGKAHGVTALRVHSMDGRDYNRVIPPNLRAAFHAVMKEGVPYALIRKLDENGKDGYELVESTPGTNPMLYKWDKKDTATIKRDSVFEELWREGDIVQVKYHYKDGNPKISGRMTNGQEVTISLATSYTDAFDGVMVKTNWYNITKETDARGWDRFTLIDVNKDREPKETEHSVNDILKKLYGAGYRYMRLAESRMVSGAATLLFGRDGPEEIKWTRSIDIPRHILTGDDAFRLYRFYPDRLDYAYVVDTRIFEIVATENKIYADDKVVQTYFTCSLVLMGDKKPEKPKKPKFDLKNYTGDYCMRCSSGKDVRTFLDLLHEDGRTWNNGETYKYGNTNWVGPHIMYFFNRGKYGRDEKPMCDGKKHEILNFDDFDWEEN